MSSSHPYSVRLASVLISISLVIIGMYWMKDFLILLSFALIFAFLLLPMCLQLEKRGIPRSLSIGISLFITMVGIFGIVALLSMQMAEFISDWPNFIKKAENWISSLQTFLSRNLNISRKKQMVELTNQTINLLKNSGEILTTTFGTMLHIITTMILVPIFVFFFLYYRNFFGTFLAKVFPQTEESVLGEIMSKTGKVVQSYLMGLFVVMLIVAIVNSIGFLWIGIDYAIFFGILTGLLLLIPYIGIWIGAIFPIILTLITLEPSHTFALIAWVAIVQFIEANFITPLVVGSKVSVNPMIAMFALLIGELIWGIPGLILAIPLIAILKVIFDHVPALEAYGYLLGEAPKRSKEKR
jgi:predicted PurR-regulated permease PerM